MTKRRLDIEMADRGLVETRSQAESFIKLGHVKVNGQPAKKPGLYVTPSSEITLETAGQYVSRAGLKLASVASILNLQFKDMIVLDVGSSTGGFTDYALQHDARKVFAVDVGTEQLHPKLRQESRIELHEKTDIRDFIPSETPDIIVIDVSFISLREILPHLARSIAGPNTMVIAMVKPQFEAGRQQVNKGVIKNDSIRRQILKDFEAWAKDLFIVVDKHDSEVTGAKGNRERFYHLRKI